MTILLLLFCRCGGSASHNCVKDKQILDDKAMNRKNIYIHLQLDGQSKPMAETHGRICHPDFSLQLTLQTIQVGQLHELYLVTSDICCATGMWTD